MGSAGYQRIDDPRRFGRVAVLMGGDSAEREISLMSGQAVQAALLRRQVDAHAVDAASDLVDQLQGGAYDRVWIALHGRGGEDGTLQGLLEHFLIPYTGSDVLGCSVSMDKLRGKYLLAGAGFATPGYRVLSGNTDFATVVAELGLPLMVKPAAEGSSIGLTKVSQVAELPAAFAAAAKFDCEVFAEAWVHGAEYTAAVLHDQVLPLIRIDASNNFYDYEAKYFSDATNYICPSALPDSLERQYREMAHAAFRAVGGSGWGRVDFMLDEQDRALLLEINTVPGMTSHSLVPMAAAEAGIDFDELVWRILETSFHARASNADFRESSDVA
jgi:D-alanine-D-alanine ligase